MSRVKIKQLDERVATSGLHMGGGLERRKLQPGEVVDISEALELPDGTPLLQALWDTGKLEMTMEPATRPLDFADATEARLTSPTFKPRGPDEQVQVDAARAAVEARLYEQSVTPPEDDLPTDSHVADSQVEVKPPVEMPDAFETTSAPVNPRAKRRAALQQDETLGKENTA